ncbi:uncharacterized protein NMK_2062 [Novimethylophilus kurashikiensis]|uniref:DUF1917 domain-containing protein n=1 Tax=Novimethylophilus kurashikiensis TaxID=1825523 RepID=A0A2R5FC09_9PROT|nr:putative phosphothreonine lyase domain-containg protein [Novimethylophilus kurashikiensis]GBG14463.1 uncharacterized protein NMK_2062 [Novimethylophilus kurashikiensis]
MAEKQTTGFNHNDDIDEFLAYLYRPSPKPSLDRSQFWHSVVNPNEVFFSTEHSGKWCIFRGPAEIDDAWDKIVESVKAGRLSHAKVSTALGRAMYGDRQVICVYTQNWTDLDELMEARDVLRELGFTEQLGYKRDIDTKNRVYGENEFYLHA